MLKLCMNHTERKCFQIAKNFWMNNRVKAIASKLPTAESPLARFLILKTELKNMHFQKSNENHKMNYMDKQYGQTTKLDFDHTEKSGAILLSSRVYLLK